jgi:hypothetical protein
MRRPNRIRPCGTRAVSFGAAALLAVALAGCASFGGQKDVKTVDPNLMPADYKASVMSFLQTNPYGLIGVRAAELSSPELKPFGTESRYVVCLRAAGPDWRKEKMFVFYAGAVNQYVDATSEACSTAAYQAFPEITALLSQLGGKK